MKVSPCRNCPTFLSGVGCDGDECRNCKKRQDYVDSLGPMCSSVPIALTDLTQPRNRSTQDESSQPITVFDQPKVKKEFMVEKPKTKVCPRNGCRHNGKPQPVDNFCLNRRAKDGRHYYCKSCQKDINKTSRENKQKKQRMATTAPQVQNRQPQAQVQPAADWMDQLFDGRSDLLAEFKTLAESQLRTPQNQLLYMVQTACQQKGAI